MTNNILTDAPPTLSQKIESINAEWIKSQMSEFKIKNMRQLAIASDVNYGALTMAISGKRPASAEIKKTLYWFFKAESLKVQLNEEKIYNRVFRPISR